jgi:hypothetical protein
MNLYDRITDILMDSFLNEGLKRRQRVAAAMNRKLHGNQSQVNPNDPNLQEPGANTAQGKQIYTSSERQSANARVAQFHNKAASAEARRGERIRKRIVQGGAGLRRMAAGAQRGNRFSPEQKAVNKELGGWVAKTRPTDVLQQSRQLQARSQQQGDNASGEARGIRFKAVNLARQKRGLPDKSRYSSRAPVGEQLPESVIMTYDRIINLMLESRLDELSAETMLRARKKAEDLMIKANDKMDTGIKTSSNPKGQDRKMPGSSASSEAHSRGEDLFKRINNRITGNTKGDKEEAKATARGRGKKDTARRIAAKAKKRKAVRMLGLQGSKPKQPKRKGEPWWEDKRFAGKKP